MMMLTQVVSITINNFYFRAVSLKHMRQCSITASQNGGNNNCMHRKLTWLATNLKKSVQKNSETTPLLRPVIFCFLFFVRMRQLRTPDTQHLLQVCCNIHLQIISFLRIVKTSECRVNI